MNGEILKQMGHEEMCETFARNYGQSYHQLQVISDEVAAKTEIDTSVWDEKLDRIEEILDKMLGEMEMLKLFGILHMRFKDHMHRHKGIKWEDVEKILRNAPAEKLRSLKWMEDTGGEPDVVELSNGKVRFVDLSRGSPIGRINCVYDRQAEIELAESPGIKKCDGNAIDMAEAAGVEMLGKGEYINLKCLSDAGEGSWDWILTPEEMRKIGKALCSKYRKDKLDFLVLKVNATSIAGFRTMLWI